jgi:mevalonate kinase
MKQVTAKAPAKLILSGEHAVVYGTPAIAAAVDLFATTTVTKRKDKGVQFSLPDLDYTKLMTVNTLRGLKNRLEQKYQQFTRGEGHVRDILQTPFELAQFVMINTADYLKASLNDVSIHTDSTIPIGCGLGSSAATSLSVVYAVAKFMDSEMQKEEYLQLGQAAEKLQHGYPSGLDVQTILQGGCLRWEDSECTTQACALSEFTVINTGKPSATTGECVAHVANNFKDSDIWQEFSAVTNDIGTALANNDMTLLGRSIEDNHQLLNTIGVVPNTVMNFSKACASNGVHVKVCGAGSCSGDNAGMLWAIGELDALPALLEEFGYTEQTLQLEQQGVHHA